MKSTKSCACASRPLGGIWGLGSRLAQSPGGTRARAVGVSRYLSSRKYSLESPKGTEAYRNGYRTRCLVGGGLGGLTFALRAQGGRQRELTNGDVKSRSHRDQNILAGKKNPILYTREQFTSNKGSWDMFNPRSTERDLQYK